MKRHWADYTAPELAAQDRARMIAILPVSAIEQHGPHLPLSVDTTIIEGIIRAVVTQLPEDLPAVFLPTQRIGKSNEHARYPGTLTLSLNTLVNLWMEIGDCVAAAGVRHAVRRHPCRPHRPARARPWPWPTRAPTRQSLPSIPRSAPPAPRTGGATPPRAVPIARAAWRRPCRESRSSASTNWHASVLWVRTTGGNP